MPRYSANLSFLQPDLAILDRFAAAKDGFPAVDSLGPWRGRQMATTPSAQAHPR